MGIFTKSSVGMEIDSKEIRVAYVEGTADKPIPRVFARHALPEGVVRDGKVASPGELATAISALWARENIKSRDVILGVNNQDVIIRFAAVPDLPKDKLYNLIHFQSTDYIPIPIHEIELDYSVVGKTSNNAGELLKLLLVAGRKNMLNDFIAALEAARMKITDISVSMLAAVRLVPEQMRNEPIVVVNLSNDFGNIVIMNQNEPGMARTIAYPSHIQPSLSRLTGQDRYDGYTARTESLEKVCNYLANEIRSSVLYYRNQEPELFFQQYYITGSHARDEGVLSGIRQLLQTDVSLLDLSSLKQAGTLAGESSSDYTVCYSLAISGLEG
ncbi:MAG: pilus assembly protein PilM [Ruminiclostridium sp.]|nr:pilus assembly protein PilM [Ruminiclostridium sp.]